MIRAFDTFSLPLLRWLDPEDAHRLAIQGLRLLPPVRAKEDDHKLAVRAFGLNFPNPIGMAAGFDKNAEAPDALLRLGQSLAALKEKEAACATLAEIPRKYPRASGNVKQSVEREQKRVGCI